MKSSTMTADTLNSIGANFLTRGQFAAAEDCFHQALDKDEQHFGAWSNLGLAYQHCGLMAEAQDCYNRALAIKPDQPSTLTCLGFLTQEAGYRDNARRLFERALEVDPACHDATANLAVLDLMAFDFKHGWERWESRYRTNPIRCKPRDYGLPEWDGKPTKCVALWPDQGVGDLILFSTLIPDLIARNQDFILEMDERLLPAYRRSFPDANFCLRSDSQTAFGFCTAQLALSSLGRFLRPTLKSFWAQPHRLLRSAKSHAIPPTVKPGKCIAISWRSFLPNAGIWVERQKSGTLEMFRPLAEREDLALVDVQYGNTEAERAAIDFPLAHYPDVDLKMDLERVMSIIDSCDAVVTTCCITAHLGGALGKPTYVMFRGDTPPLFSWQPNNGRSIWYPSVRIINGGTDWLYLIARINKQL